MRSFIVPNQLSVQLVSLNRNYQLVVLSLHYIPVCQDPSASSLRLVVLEMTLEVCSIRICPSTRKESVLDPFSNVFHAGRIKDIGSLAVLTTVEPVS